MVLLIDNSEVESVLTIQNVMETLEAAFVAVDQGLVASRPRTFTSSPTQRGKFVANTHEGILASEAVYNIRIVTSIRPPPSPADSQNIEPRLGLNVSLDLLYSLENGDLLAIIHDGQLQKMRVQATNAIAARYMARTDAGTMALIGSGWQATAAIEAMRAVRPIQTVRVFSRDPQNRQRFVEQMRRIHSDIRVEAVDTAQEAVRRADMVVAATNSRVPVCKGEWVEPGMHLTGVLTNEFDLEAYRRADYIVIFNRLRTHDYTLSRGPEELPLPDSPPAPFLEGAPDLIDLISGKAPRRVDDQQITIFANGGNGWGKDGGTGHPVQFTAVAKLVYDLARQRGLGRELPLEWFQQSANS